MKFYTERVHKLTKLLVMMVSTIVIFVLMNMVVDGTYGVLGKVFLLIANTVPSAYLIDYLDKLSSMKKKQKGNVLKYGPELLTAVVYQIGALYMIVFQFPIALSVLIGYLLLSGLAKLVVQLISGVGKLIKA